MPIKKSVLAGIMFVATVGLVLSCSKDATTRQVDPNGIAYSFDFKDAHFATLNTDAVGKDWHLPTAWVTNDLTAARARSGVKHIFVIEHKPAYSDPTVATDGLEGVFSAHNHEYWRAQPTGKTWQVIAGNGGTPLDASLDVTIPSTGACSEPTLNA